MADFHQKYILIFNLYLVPGDNSHFRVNEKKIYNTTVPWIVFFVYSSEIYDTIFYAPGNIWGRWELF